jgi:ribosomal-protein-alanine N-acetyltransferase
VPREERPPSLLGERPRRGHAGHYVELFAEERVAATLWPGPGGGPRTAEQARAILRGDIEHWRRLAFGPGPFFTASAREFVGRGGLASTSAAGVQEIELLYAVRPELWGQGHAGRIAALSLQRARALGLSEVVGHTLLTNIASRRVLERAGFAFERVIEHAGLPHWYGRRTLR